MIDRPRNLRLARQIDPGHNSHRSQAAKFTGNRPADHLYRGAEVRGAVRHFDRGRASNSR